jgi:hypothetical protein
MTAFSFSWRDPSGAAQNTSYDVQVSNVLLPVVILLHGANGRSTDFETGQFRSDSQPFDYNSPLSAQMDLGWHWNPASGVRSIELDGLLPDVGGWRPFLNQNGYSTVSYTQIDPGGLAARNVIELGALLNHLLIVALPTLAMLDSPPVCFLTHSRGGIIVRKMLKDNVTNPLLQGRIDKVITLCAPHQGSEIVTALDAPRNQLETTASSFGSLGTPIQNIVDTLMSAAGALYWQEVTVGSPFLTDLSNDEEPFPGARYYTFGGTNITYSRIRGWWYTGDSSSLHWHKPPFHWQAYNAEVSGVSPVMDSLPHPTDELTGGKGDILVADARAHLPFSVQVTHPISHPQYLFDAGAQAEVLSILNGQFRNRSAIAEGEPLRTNDALVSDDGQYKAIMQDDGNFVVYQGASPVWASNTVLGNLAADYFLRLQADGNLWLFAGTPESPITEYWIAGPSQGKGAYFARLENGGSLNIYQGTPIWASNTNVATPPFPLKQRVSTIGADEFLGRNQSLTSGDGRFTAVMQTDGNFVVYDGNAPLWASNTNFDLGAYFAAMQLDGNFVVYTGSPQLQGAPLWASATNLGAGPYFLTMQADGNLVVYQGVLVWGTFVTASIPIQITQATPLRKL